MIKVVMVVLKTFDATSMVSFPLIRFRAVISGLHGPLPNSKLYLEMTFMKTNFNNLIIKAYAK